MNPSNNPTVLEHGDDRGYGITIQKKRSLPVALYDALMDKEHPTNTRKQFLSVGSATLAAGLSRIPLMKLTPQSEMADLLRETPKLEMAKQFGIFGGLTGGLAYAGSNLDDKKKRNIGLGVTGLSLAAMLLEGRGLGAKDLAMHSAEYLVPAVTIGGAIATGVLGNRMANEKEVARLMASGVSAEDALKIVATDRSTIDKLCLAATYVERPELVDNVYESIFKRASILRKQAGFAANLPVLKDVYGKASPGARTLWDKAYNYAKTAKPTEVVNHFDRLGGMMDGTKYHPHEIEGARRAMLEGTKGRGLIFGDNHKESLWPADRFVNKFAHLAHIRKYRR